MFASEKAQQKIVLDCAFPFPFIFVVIVDLLRMEGCILIFVRSWIVLFAVYEVIGFGRKCHQKTLQQVVRAVRGTYIRNSESKKVYILPSKEGYFMRISLSHEDV